LKPANSSRGVCDGCVCCGCCLYGLFIHFVYMLVGLWLILSVM